MFEIRHEHMENTVDTQSAYNEIYRNQGILLRDSFYLWVISLLQPQPGKLLIDISCGQGRLVDLACELGLHVIGLDFAIEGIRKAHMNNPKADWIVGDGECLPFPNQSVDYITHIGSLEHYQAPNRGAMEVFRVLKSNGRAIILVPNAFGLLGNIKHVYLKGEIFDDGQPLQRYATRKNWENLLEGAGLRVIKTVSYGEVEFPRTYHDFIWFLRSPHKAIKYALNFLIPINLANHFVFICSRA